MLETGQPMHAYDLAQAPGRLTVRFAQQGEPLTLLDGKDIEVDADMLVIADEQGPVGLAGIMGGERTAVSAETRISSSKWPISPRRRSSGGRDAGAGHRCGQRFERGVDPTQQDRAMERATAI